MMKAVLKALLKM